MIPARGLHPDKNIAQDRSRHKQVAAINHDVSRWRAPSLDHLLLHGFRQRTKPLLIAQQPKP